MEIKLMRYLILILFLAFAIPVTAQKIRPDVRNKLLDLRASAKYDEAISLLNELVETEPNNPQIYLERAEFFGLQNISEKVIADINTAIALKPADEMIYLTRAKYYSAKGDYKATLEDVRTAVSIAPDNFHILKDGSKLLSDGKQFEENIKLTDFYISRKQSINGSNWYLNSLAYRIRSENKFAIQNYAGALEDSIKSLELIYFTGDAWKDLGASIELGDPPQLNLIAAVTRKYLRNDVRIFDYYQRIFDVLEKQNLLSAEQGYRLSLGKEKDSIINPEDLAKYQDTHTGPGIIKFRMLMADCADLYAQKGQPEKGIELYDRIIKIRPAFSGYRYRADYFISLGKYQDAVDDLNMVNAVREKPFSDALMRRGDVYVLMNRFDEAIADYETVKKLYNNLGAEADAKIADVKQKQLATQNKSK